jgi:hypothetical protein
VEKFRSKVINKLCKIDIFSVVNDRVSVRLIVGNENINLYTVTHGNGKRCSESYPSRIDNILRQRLMSENWKPSGCFDKKVNTMFKHDIPSPPLNKCQYNIKLRGPMSPLEKSLVAVSNFRNFSSISIDPLSVNSVILDDVEEYEGKLIVAADISQNKIEDTTLHYTSVFPKITGLPVLLAMIFAQDVIFYYRKLRVYGIKYGLGAYPDRTPLFEAHDCVLPVNFKLNMDDVSDINDLRCNMSYLMKENDSDDDGEKKKSLIFMEIKRILLKILSKERALVSPFLSNISGGSHWTVKYKHDDKHAIDFMEYKPLTFPTLTKKP